VTLYIYINIILFVVLLCVNHGLKTVTDKRDHVGNLVQGFYVIYIFVKFWACYEHYKPL
jgi:hypothetical protein